MNIDLKKCFESLLRNKNYDSKEEIAGSAGLYLFIRFNKNLQIVLLIREAFGYEIFVPEFPDEKQRITVKEGWELVCLFRETNNLNQEKKELENTLIKFFGPEIIKKGS